MSNLNNALIAEGRQINLEKLERASKKVNLLDTISGPTTNNNTISPVLNFYSNSLTPSEVARKTKKTMQDLAYSF